MSVLLQQFTSGNSDGAQERRQEERREEKRRNAKGQEEVACFQTEDAIQARAPVTRWPLRIKI